MYGGEEPFSEPQSRFLRDHALLWKPVAFINVHSGESAVYIPWDSRDTMGAHLPVRKNWGALGTKHWGAYAECNLTLSPQLHLTIGRLGPLYRAFELLMRLHGWAVRCRIQLPGLWHLDGLDVCQAGCQVPSDP